MVQPLSIKSINQGKMQKKKNFIEFNTHYISILVSIRETDPLTC